MSGLSGLAKGGWHPKGKDGNSRESWRGDFKGINQMAGWMGKGKGPGSDKEDPRQHSSAPLSTLKDPASFGPPPKHAHYYGAEAAAATSKLPDTAPTVGDRSGWGAPVPAPTKAAEEQAAAEEEERRRGPALPYRANTTGIDPASLPKPPTRKDLPFDGENTAVTGTAPTTTKPKPPPRLPPRQNSNPDQNAPSPPPTYTAAISSPSKAVQPGQINQGAASRLGQAGVSVPGFNIGGFGSKSPATPSTTGRQQPGTTAGPSTDQRSELASRFAKLGKPSSPSSSPAPAAGTSAGTSWAQKQAALSTASKFQKDPSSVSLSDARSTLSTANNFRERHGDQVAAGIKQANGINQKYGVADKAKSFGMGRQESPSSEVSNSTTAAGPGTDIQSASQQALGAIAAKKAPPPKPPPKKQGLNSTTLGGSASDAAAPPPIPLGTKPR